MVIGWCLVTMLASEKSQSGNIIFSLVSTLSPTRLLALDSAVAPVKENLTSLEQNESSHHRARTE